MQGSEPPPKKSKLSSLVSSRLKSVKLAKQAAPVEPEEIQVSEVEFNQMQINDNESGTEPQYAQETVEWDSDKWNEELIMIPRLSTITERDEPSLRYQAGNFKLDGRTPVTSKAPSSVRSHATSVPNVTSGSNPTVHPFVQTNLLYQPARSSTSSSGRTPVRPLSTVSTATSEISHPPDVDQPPDNPDFMLSPTSSMHFGDPEAREGERSSTMSSLGSLRHRQAPTTHSPAPASTADTPAVNGQSLPTVVPVAQRVQTSASVSERGTVHLPDNVEMQSQQATTEGNIEINKTMSAPSNPTKPPSKLMQLAQARVHRNKPPDIASRPTTIQTGVQIPTGVISSRSSGLTTAITTSYQTLDSLTALQSSPPKKSKLHMKVQQQRAAKPVGARAEDGDYSVEDIPMFSPMFASSTPVSSIRNVPPSAFASLLVNDEVPMSSPPRPAGRLGHRYPPDVSPPSSTSRVFAFDSPSPDDIVSKARKGTALRTGVK